MEAVSHAAALQVGQSAVIDRLSDPGIAARLMAMGLMPGTSIRLRRIAPFGGAVYLESNQHAYALRKEEAETIIIHPIR